MSISKPFMVYLEKRSACIPHNIQLQGAVLACGQLNLGGKDQLQLDYFCIVFITTKYSHVIPATSNNNHHI